MNEAIEWAVYIAQVNAIETAKALARCSLDGLPGGANPPGEPRLDGDVSPHLQPARRRGIFAFGRYGCGKTALLKAIRPLFEPVHFVPLNDPDYALRWYAESDRPKPYEVKYLKALASGLGWLRSTAMSCDYELKARHGE